MPAVVCIPPNQTKAMTSEGMVGEVLVVDSLYYGGIVDIGS